MVYIHPVALAHERKRWMRADAHRFLRSDWRRFVKPSSELVSLYESYEGKYSPDQPRVPAGSSEGGQWTSEGGGAGSGRNDPRVISDATPDPARPGAQYAQTRRAGFAPVLINGQLIEPTPAQGARLTVAESQAAAAIRRVQDLDPNWKPTQSLYSSVENLIGAYEADAQQARDRLYELQSVGIGPGLFAGDSIPARGPQRDFTAAERRAINGIGAETGCHTCGTKDAGTLSGNFVPDHQLPNILNPLGRAQRLYPQCISCSDFQGGWISGNRRR